MKNVIGKLQLDQVMTRSNMFGCTVLSNSFVQTVYSPQPELQIMMAALPPVSSLPETLKDPPVFIDLGSGLGRVVMQAALLCGSSFSRYVGLELSASRLDQAEHVLARLREEAGRQADAAASSALARVDFYEEDVTQSPWLDKATHVFICSTAFGAAACRQIVDRLAASDR